MWIALTRAISPRIAEAELSFVDRQPIDLALAERQHAAYQALLTRLGCELHALPPAPDLPDSVFVEDTAVVVDEIAVLTRPGAPSRRPEVASMAEVLARWRPIQRIVEPGCLDGGDVLRIGERLFVGRSARSNEAGAEQLRVALQPFDYRVQTVAMKDCLHLKSAVTALDDETVLINRDWVDASVFADYRKIEVAADEPHAANVLRVGDQLVMPSGFDGTAARLRAAGFSVHETDLSELQKAEGATTCCSVVFRTR